MAINGNNIIIGTMSGTTFTPLAATKSNEIQSDCEMIEISSQSVGDWRAFMAGRKSWSVQTSFLVTAASDIRKVLTVGTSYTLLLRDRTNTSSVTGTAILQTCKISAIRGNLCTGSFVFKGNGALA